MSEAGTSSTLIPVSTGLDAPEGSARSKGDVPVYMPIEYSRGLLGARSLKSHGAVFHRNLLLAATNGRDIGVEFTEHLRVVCVSGHACILSGVSLFCLRVSCMRQNPRQRGVTLREAIVTIVIGSPKIY